ncbi:hypothetical protein LPJ61_004133 [Coemansia biformis]|uniref:6,7-dimethyl-8-ribityllumazine synthase n=1 Tax=Coemansia biformis TaxID=1286918 RepID=A0A9W7YCH9_9FUNG|nr:hypothetical protein LPJ61_004133 [Coemansia biformis]
MKAVTSLRTRMRMLGDAADAPQPHQPPAPLPPLALHHQIPRRRACTSGSEAYALLSPPPADGGPQRAWAVGPRKLRGLHPAPVIIYVRENADLVAQAMDGLYGALTLTHNIDARDIRVADVPTVYDLPSAVRRMGKGKQLVITVALLTRDSPWFDADQIGRARDFILEWSQTNAIPLVDGVLVAESPADMLHRISSPRWNVIAGDGAAADDSATAAEDASAAATDVVSAASSDSSPQLPEDDFSFGHYLAHRAIEMFYVEHRGW